MNSENYIIYYSVPLHTKPVAGSQFLGGALQKECNRGAGMILTRPPPPAVDNFLGKKIFPTSTLQLLSRYFISNFIFGT